MIIPVIYELYTDLAPDGTFYPSSKKVSSGFIQKYATEPENINKNFKFDRY